MFMDACGFIVVDSIRLEYQRWAGAQTAKPPIMLIHEALGSVSIWRDFPAALAQRTGHEVIAWSRQGHGGSGRPAGPRSSDYLAQEAALVPQVMDAFSVPKAHLFGHSDGATMAILAGALFPERVASLILEAPHVNVEQKALDGIGVARQAYETTDLAKKLKRHHQDVEHVFWSWHDVWLSSSFRDWNIEECLAGIKMPVLAIQGVQDEYFSMAQVDLIVANTPYTQRLEIENCGHSPHRDQLEVVLQATVVFLASQ
ncbi:alpha/beta fold hydrolase [Glaciimonas sp. PCH181]|uniref:alpha/beta fold hydrolase n=1 Tax=Glaciimonas sp. PCH181 TaxID=2133943 RepID=UPI000D3451C1|nr:alpha/beta hydrolase [Glaciimonas sp. PCH181]PUA18658.1 alpha/beta hydrolase [Glaciimonas sp. PCH181]